MMLLVTRSSMTGFLVFDYADRYPEALAELAAWYGSGRIASRETLVTGGVEDFPDTLLKLFEGVNTGKLILAL
jgi:NADPH-dependent curcumin reductase CurA